MRAMGVSVVSKSVPVRNDPQPAAEPVAPDLPAQVSDALNEFVQSHLELLHAMSPDLDLLGDAARSSVLGGGKRLRPTFAYWGWRTAQPAGAEHEPALLRAAASLELLQACALVHDDLMDGSDTRRGQPAAHIRFARYLTGTGWPGSAESFGRCGAILLGDLLLSWAEEMFTQAISTLSAERAGAAQQQFDLMRTEVVAGQFLDVLAQSRGAFDVDEALRVIRFKTSKYTVIRPLLLGAAAAGADPQLCASLQEYGDALGEAFQLRDDLLGVFGDPSETGKPAGDDLREGKRTLLVALAVRTADRRQLQLIQSGVGNPALTDNAVTELRQVLIGTGARDAVEARIAERAEHAASCLIPAIADEARAALLELVAVAAHRSS
jgi:geranylgeranyl diphosphate synthase type I